MFKLITKPTMFLALLVLTVLFSANSYSQKVVVSVGQRTLVGNTYNVELLATVAAGQTNVFDSFDFTLSFNTAALDYGTFAVNDEVMQAFNTNQTPPGIFAAGVVSAIAYERDAPGTISVNCLNTGASPTLSGTFSLGYFRLNVINSAAMDNLAFYDVAGSGSFFDNGSPMTYGTCADCFNVIQPVSALIGPCTPPAAPVAGLAPATGNDVVLNWTGTATSFNIEYTTAATWTGATATTATGASTSKAITGLAANTYHWRIQAVGATPACTSAWVDGPDFTTSNGPAPCTTPALPVLSATVPTVNGATLSWTSNAQYYIVEYSLASDFTVKSTVTPNPTTATTVIAGLTPATNYYFRVKGVNVSGPNVCETEFVQNSFTTLCNTPAMPTGLATTNITTTGAHFEFTQVPDVTFFIRYGSTLPLTGAGSPTMNTFAVSDLTAGTTYYWQIKAQNSTNSCASEWSDPVQFATVALPPALVTPANNATCLTSPVQLTWGTVANATEYNVQVIENGVATPVVDQTTATVTYSATVSNNKAYTWQVRAKVNGVWTAFSAAYAFATTIPAPATVAPANNATKVAYLPTLEATPVAGATEYHFQVSTTADFLNIVADVLQPGVSLTLTTPLANFTPYFWRVEAHTAACESGWSTVATFKTKLELTAPVLAMPANAAVNVALVANLDWNNVANATSYVVEIDDNPAFTTPEIVNVPAESMVEFTSTMYNAQYFWHAKAVNTAEAVESAFSTTFSFTTMNIPAPVLLTPAADAVVAVSPAPVFTWTAVPHATSYTLTIATLGGESEEITGITGTSYTMLNPAWNTDYTWFVTAHQGANFMPAEPRTFATVPVPVPTNLAPNGIQKNVEAPVELTWNTVAGATGYVIEFANAADFTGSALIPVAVNHYTHAPVGEGAHFWRVRTVIGEVTSAWSATATFTSVYDTPLSVSFASTSQSVCSGDYAQLSAPIIANGRPNASYTYAWTPAANVNNSMTAQPWAMNIPANTTVTFTLVITEVGSNRTATATQSVTVNTQPVVAVPSVYRRTLAQATAGINLNAQITSPTAGYTFTWTDRFNADITASATSYVPTTTTTGLYRTNVVAHLGSCESVSKNMYIFVTLRRDSEESFTINENGAAMYAYNANNGGDLTIQAYFGEESNIEVSLVNILGETVATFNRFGNNLDESFDIHNLSAGMYVVVVKGSNGVMTQKIIKN